MIDVNDDFLQRSAALKIDWARITTSLGLKGQTSIQLQGFKKRNEDARRKVMSLLDAPQEIDFVHYHSILKNQTVVNEIESAYKAFKPLGYDVSRTLAAIESFEATAIENAQATKGKVDTELSDLQTTLKNIEEARSFEELTVVRILLMVRVFKISFLSCFFNDIRIDIFTGRCCKSSAGC